ncbi:COPII coat assembly protein sec-16, variant 1 [Rhypophila decipiens]|uniref:Protein transport protein sec16 n=1 Tax=Rhypophila decipiens TaxID=261697 RepID=A0AAN6YFX6_9PEZI|nr:COPII coat assembly protein sec-16, variant 1 [Rhypophila decipiens]
MDYSAHWNPAFRPDTLSALTSRPSTEAEPILDSQPSKPAPQAEPTIDTITADESIDKGQEEVVSLAQTTGQDSGDHATDHDVDAQVPAEVVQPDEADDTRQNETPEPDNEISQHTSRMSFARTVSHDMNWNDDDEPEWNLTRTGTDPFKSMPPNDRTNSFPPVPPLHTEQQQVEPDVSIPEELVEEQTSLETFDPNLGPVGHDLPKDLEEDQDGNENDNQIVMGGEETEDADAGFLEDAPLISPGKDTVTEDDTGKQQTDLFGDEDAAEDDDFFAQIEEKGDDQEQTAPEQAAAVTNEDAQEEPAQFASGVPQTEEVSTPKAASEADHDAAPKEISEEPSAEQTAESGGAFWDDLEGEDEFLPDEPAEAVPEEPTEAEVVDPTGFQLSDDEGFLPSDDEGFLEDSDDQQPAAEEAPITPTAPPATTSRYLPASQAPRQPLQSTQSSYFPPVVTPAQTPNIYAPSGATPGFPLPAATPFAAPPSAPPASTAYGYGAPPLPKPPVTKAQSFADKSKGGYQSPYDLPMEVVKPKKRASLANLQKTTPGPNGSVPVQVAPPPGSASLQSPLVPPPAASPRVPPQGNFSQPPPAQKPGPTQTKSQFFEDLPIVAKPRPSSRHSNKSTPSPQHSPYGPPPPSGLPPVAHQPSVPQVPQVPNQAPGGIPNLVAPPPVNPYASLPSNPSNLNPGLPAATSTRYSPAPPNGAHINGSIPPPTQSRYSPAPPVVRSASAGYAPSAAAPAPPILPHQPRTSSPLAHFEISHEKSRASVVSHSDAGQPERRSSSSMYDPRLQRVPSLPPTREVEEDESQDHVQTTPKYAPSLSPPTSRHGPLAHRPRNTPPPPSNLAPSPLSPPKRATSGHIPPMAPNDFVPPPRSQTQSPGALYGNRNGKPAEPVPRPSSVHDPAPPRSALYSAAPPPVANSVSTSPVMSRSRGFSQNLNLIAPTDGRENDALQRWRGSPLISWGVGGTIVTMFPKDVPRYGVHQTTPMILRSPGEVKVKSAKDIQPLEDRLAKFPGPLKGKSKKKEVISWLSSGIEVLEQGLPTGIHALQQATHDDKRAVERALLWKILRVMVEHDGALEGSPAVEKAVRDVLFPDADKSAAAPLYLNAGNTAGLNGLGTAATHSDAVDSSVVEQIRLHLQNGDAEKAVWTAVDKRLWGHALLLANALAPALYKQVSQEFVKKEINVPGQNNESLAALYAVLSGNHEESIDELVPISARSGHQLVSANSAHGATKDALEGLDKWRETLGLILSNRSAEDSRAINSLGNLLSGYGRAEAAHICFLFARTQTIFGGLDDPASNFVLLGSDHKRQAEQFAKEIEPLLLSEVYEYAQTLATGPSAPVSNPHLAAYKLQHALALAEYGFRDKALEYCEAIAAAITAQTKRSPYHHPILEAAVEDLMKRLKLAPKEGSNSWIPKPSMGKVSDSMWNRFNKFVAGDDNDASGQGSPHEEAGPFARIAGGTPTISRPPSANNLETFGAAAIPNYGVPTPSASAPVLPALSSSAPSTKAASRYAPSAGGNPYDPSSTYAPRSSMDRSSGEYQRSSVDLPRRSSEYQPGHAAASYSPNTNIASPPISYTPQYGQNAAPAQQSPYAPVSSPPQTSTPSFGYEPLGLSNGPMNGNATGPVASAPEPSQPFSTGGYQPYGYEPPSQNSYEPPSQPSNEDNKAETEAPATNTFEPPSYQPYGFEPPSYEPDSQPADDSDEESKPKKKRGPMYDDDEDDFGAPKKPAEKTKEEKDRENAEMFRKAAEEDAKRAEAAKQTKKGWLGGWFGGGAKKDSGSQDNASSSDPKKPVRAKLGEANSFYYDPELKRWINKNASPEDNAPKKSAPPPPRSAPVTPRTASSSPAPPGGPPMAIPGGLDAGGRESAPPPPAMGRPAPRSASVGPALASQENGSLAAPGGPPMMRSVSQASAASAGGPPSRPSTALSNSSSIDDLLAAAGPRKAGAKKAKKGARYLDVMSQ